MEHDARQVLEDCWRQDDDALMRGRCRWCSFEQAGQHANDCPCAALSVALDQRDALVELWKAEKQYLRMQGVARSARKAGREGARQRAEKANKELEKALQRVHELGLEEMLR